jgi:predicted RNase H-like nuclease (RuvC/YqgF family)
MSNIAERLRHMELAPCDEAADEIDRLRAEVASLKSDLESYMRIANDEANENVSLTQQLAAAKEYAERLREALEEVSGLINESSGVYGLHLNGDPSPWEELLPGGKFEWLASFDEAIALPKPWDKTDV